MSCEVLFEIKKYVMDNASGIAAFIISVLSLIISWKAYKRDDPKLLLNFYKGEIRNGSTFKIEKTGLIVSIANVGKNPTKLGSLGGSTKYFKIKRICSFVLRGLNPKGLEPTEFLVSSVHVDNHLRKSGDFHTLPSGERMTFMIDDPAGKELAQHIATESSCAYIFDAIGNKYFVSGAQFSKLKRDYKKL